MKEGGTNINGVLLKGRNKPKNIGLGKEMGALIVDEIKPVSRIKKFRFVV